MDFIHILYQFLFYLNKIYKKLYNININIYIYIFSFSYFSTLS